MMTIRTSTQIYAPLERCFRLALSVDLEHQATGNKAIEGVTRGLMGPGERVIWCGPGLGHRHEAIIDIWRPFSYFRDVMVSGDFGAFEHDHHFAIMDDGTRVRNEIRFTVPSGLSILSHAAELLLRRRIIKLLRQRSSMIKRVAESEEWHYYLDGQPELDKHIYQALSATSQPHGHVYAR